ncbi:MAG: SAVED domain-containing protein [Armatimonadota bacterium]
MSKTRIPEKVKIQLWGKAAGRCQYCNKPLWFDSLTKFEFNSAYIAHIYADQPEGPRYDPVLSPKLKADISNLMLMCDECHRRIDREDVAGHPADILIEMKHRQESRIDMLTGLEEYKKSHVLLYGANIGKHSAPITWNKAVYAMLPDRYPAERSAIELSLKNSLFQDDEPHYWEIEREHLRRQFDTAMKSRLRLEHTEHLSVFALAPQPLLIELGRLLSDIPTAQVFQLHREPPDWKWQEHPEAFQFLLHESGNRLGNVALNLSLSATIDNSRIINVLGEDTSIWTLTVASPNNDFLKSREQLSQFRQVFRLAMDMIKAFHGYDSILHVFPATPVSVAVEIGRTWMPKADMPLRIYDENRKLMGFHPVFDITSY